MAERPSFVIEDQSEVIAFLEGRLAPARRIDTHGAVVFLGKDLAYKLKRSVKFPYMDFSTAEARGRMCRAEIEVNRRMAPEIYLGVAPVRRAAGKLVLGEIDDAPDDAGQTPLWHEAQETPETQMLRQRDATSIRRLVSALAEPFRETFVLREIHNLSYREIADIIEAPVGTVMSRLARARAMLRSAWLAEEEQPK